MTLINIVRTTLSKMMLIKQMTIIKSMAMDTAKFVKPFAELSVIEFWYFWSIDILFLHPLITQKIIKEVAKYKIGTVSICIVTDLCIIGLAIVT